MYHPVKLRACEVGGRRFAISRPLHSVWFHAQLRAPARLIDTASVTDDTAHSREQTRPAPLKAEDELCKYPQNAYCLTSAAKTQQVLAHDI